MKICIALLALLAVAACGTGPGSSPDAGDATTTVELCNGVDDTGEGLVDEGCPCASFDVTTPGNLYEADIAWTGDRYFVVTKDMGMLEISPVIDGVFGTPFIAGTLQTWPAIHDLAWTGTELAVLVGGFSQSIELVRFDAAGTELGRETLASDVAWQRVTWVGDRFVVAGPSKTGNQTFVLAEHSPMGSPLGTPIEIRYLYNLTYIATAAATPEHYVVAAASIAQAEAFLIDRTTHTGAVVDLEIGNQFSQVSTVRVADQFVVTTSGSSSTGFGGDEIEFLDASGARVRRYAQIFVSLASKIVPDGAGAIAVAQVTHDATHNHLLAVRLDADGVPIEPPLLPLAVTAGPAGSFLDATSAAERVAVSVSSGGSVHVVQHCY